MAAGPNRLWGKQGGIRQRALKRQGIPVKYPELVVQASLLKKRRSQETTVSRTAVASIRAAIDAASEPSGQSRPSAKASAPVIGELLGPCSVCSPNAQAIMTGCPRSIPSLRFCYTLNRPFYVAKYYLFNIN